MITIVGEAPSRSSDPTRPFCGWSGNWLARRAGLDGYDELASRARLVNLLRRWPGAGYAGEKGSRFPIVGATRAARKVELLGVVLLAGRRVARAFDRACPGGVRLERAPYFAWHGTDRHGPCRMAVIPHPSGVNAWWNAPENRALAEAFLRGLFATVKREAA